MKILIVSHGGYLSKTIACEAQKNSITCLEVGNLDSISTQDLTSIDVIISLLGNDLYEFRINQEIILISEKLGIKFLLISSLGCGDSWINLSLKARELFGLKVRFKTLSEEWLKSSQLNWKIIRPIGITKEIIEGNLVLNTKYHENGKYINIYDFSNLLVKEISNDIWNKDALLYAYMDK